MIIKVSGLIIIRRQVGKGMRGTALVHRSLGLKMALGEALWGGERAGAPRRARRGRGFGFALSQAEQ